MSEFVVGQKVQRIGDPHLSLRIQDVGLIKEIVSTGHCHSCGHGDHYRMFGEECGSHCSSYLQTIIQSMDDVVVGMTLTHLFKGEVKVLSWDSEIGKIEYLYLGQKWYTKDLGNFKEYKPIKEFIIKEEEDMTKEYKVVKPFSILDIYKARPISCQFFYEEFEALLEEWENKYNCSGIVHSMICLTNYKVLIRNLSWLEQKGFIEEKTEDIELKVGMKLKNIHEYKVIDVGDNKIGLLDLKVNIISSVGCELLIFSKGTTLSKVKEKLNKIKVINE